MKRAQPEIDKRIADGTLVGQITLWQDDMVVYKAKAWTPIEEEEGLTSLVLSGTIWLCH